jgi:hypothetical protein
MVGGCTLAEYESSCSEQQGSENYIRYQVEVIGQAERRLVLVEIEEDRQGICVLDYILMIRYTSPPRYVPATLSNSLSLRPKNSTANRDSSGEAGL